MLVLTRRLGEALVFDGRLGVTIIGENQTNWVREMRVYLAGPLFTLAERMFNQLFATIVVGLDPSLKFIIPQLTCAGLAEKPDGPKLIHQKCLEGIEQCELVVAVLDGSDADSGTCIEMGLATAAGKPVVGVRTDFRASEDRGMNIMVAQTCRELVRLPGCNDLTQLADETVEAIHRVQGWMRLNPLIDGTR